MKKLTILPFVISMFVACSARNIKIHNPANPNEQKKFSIFAFALFKKAPSLFGEFAMPFNITNIELSEVLTVDEKNKKVGVTPFYPEKTIEVQEGDNKAIYGQVSNLEKYYAMLLKDEKKKYCITKVTWTRQDTVSCGPNCTRTITTTYNRYPNPYQSFKAFPIQAEPGKISFKGIVEMKEAEIQEDDPENPPFKFFEFVFLTKKWKKTLINPVIDFSWNDLKKEYFLNKEDTDPSSAKKRFLTKFIERQATGFWKEESEKELAKIK